MSTGKLMAAGAAACLALGAAGIPVGAEEMAVDLELVIAVDVSGSMDREEFALQRDGYVAAIRHPEFVGAVRSGDFGRIALAYVEWSGSDRQSVIVPWRVIDGAESADAFADALAAQPLVIDRGTSISAALIFATSLFATNDLDGQRRVIDISGDGPNNFGPTVTMARDYAVGEGVVVNGLPILIRPSPLFPAMDRYYTDCVIGGIGAFVLPVRAKDEFALAIRRKLVIEVASRPGDPQLLHAAAYQPADCMVGERLRSKYADPYLPGL
ncbi:MAG TPA: DUF1194 domain-containing protein [Bauldia sp.]|nr:DUF1194 domain-containing protein [Bauldia sp.]